MVVKCVGTSLGLWHCFQNAISYNVCVRHFLPKLGLCDTMHHPNEDIFVDSRVQYETTDVFSIYISSYHTSLFSYFYGDLF